MRASVFAALFAAGAIASPINRRDLVVETEVVYHTAWVTTVVPPGGATPTPTPSSVKVDPVAAPSSAAPSSAAPVVTPVAPVAPVVTPAAVAPSVPSPAAFKIPFSSPAPQQQDSPTGPTDYATTVLEHHNAHRANHSASALEWDSDLEASAQQIANTCIFEHSMNVMGQSYGQNIAAGVDSSDVGSVISDLFYNGEYEAYSNYFGADPDMGSFEGWGHLTQVLWKDTTHVACATADCSAQGGVANAGGSAPYFTVCNYRNAGNMGGEYASNVGTPLGKQIIDGATAITAALLSA